MTVHLVGAGPGDPELLTVRAMRLIAAADVIVHDALASDEIIALARPGVELIDVGKKPGNPTPQELINTLLVHLGSQGLEVVRLKGGDPFVFGRGGEEALALAMAGIPFDVVPGVTTAVAAPELAGIPITHRGVASGFLVLAGHTDASVDNSLGAVRPNSLSIVMLMGVGARASLAAQLMGHGWAPATPAAIVCSASMPEEWVWTGRLDQMGAAEPPAGAAGVLVIGEVVTIRERLARTAATGDEVRHVGH